MDALEKYRGELARFREHLAFLENPAVSLSEGSGARQSDRKPEAIASTKRIIEELEKLVGLLEQD